MPHKDPDAKRAYRAAYAAKRRADPTFAEKAREATRRWLAKKKKEDTKYATSKSRQRVVSKYRLTEAVYRLLLDSQGWTCAICGAPHIDETHKRLHVDHCHSTGAIRGLLCGPCNVALGKMKDNPHRLRAAAEYLEFTS